MGATRHLVQHASSIIEVFGLSENLSVHIHSGVGCNHHNIEITKPLGNDVGFTLCKSLHVREWCFVNEWSFIDVSRFNVEQHLAFTTCFV
jgi:hypothetical protein